MAKIGIQDLAKAVAKKHKLGQKDVEQFLSAMFQVVDEGLDADKQVKIKGLGTFKVTAVKQRESVNVNTGDRVVIEGHEKVSFTPETSMKELVNKPFAQFETVPLNDDVTFAEPNQTPEENQEEVSEVEETTREVAAEAPEATAEAPKATAEALVEAVAAAETVAEAPKETVAAQEVAPEAPEVVEKASEVAERASVVPTTPIAKAAEVSVPEHDAHPNADTQETDRQDVAPTQNKRNTWLLSALLAIACFALGYLLGRNSGSSVPKENVPAVEVADTQQVDTLVTEEASATEATATPVAEATQDGVDLAKVNADPRVKYGAYEITGVEETVTLRKGQTLKSYSRMILGNGMECYFQALNDTSDLGEGDVLKVPKVQVKKRK